MQVTKACYKNIQKELIPSARLDETYRQCKNINRFKSHKCQFWICRRVLSLSDRVRGAAMEAVPREGSD